MKAVLLAPITAYLYAGLFVAGVWTVRVVVAGYRARQTVRRNPLRALGRIYQRSWQ